SHLRPQLRTCGAAAPRPNALERRGAARIAPPVLVVPLAEEGGRVRRERAALQLGEGVEPGIEIAELEPRGQVRARGPQVEIAVHRGRSRAQARFARLQRGQDAR